MWQQLGSLSSYLADILALTVANQEHLLFPFQERHELVVEVRSDDHVRVVPRVARVVVDVEVIDINDNAPIFINQPYYAILSKALGRVSSQGKYIEMMPAKVINSSHSRDRIK